MDVISIKLRSYIEDYELYLEIRLRRCESFFGIEIGCHVL